LEAVYPSKMGAVDEKTFWKRRKILPFCKSYMFSVFIYFKTQWHSSLALIPVKNSSMCVYLYLLGLFEGLWHDNKGDRFVLLKLS
jgi:hypothetical protein